MDFELGPNRYGKAGVHIATVTRGEDRHDFAERMLEVRLEGDFDAVHVEGDNASVLPTDTMRSAAYALSFDGPGQELEAFAITPICPHTLANRSVVDSADKVYTLSVRRTDGAWLIVDGQEQVALTVGHLVTIRRAPVRFRLVKVPGHTYYQTLRDKLRWGTPPRYRNEPLAAD